MCLSLDRAEAGLKAAPTPNLIALFLGVWVIYLFDRILDLSRVSSTELTTKRHQWARDHFTLIAWLGVTALGLLVMAVLPRLEKATVLAGFLPGLMTLVYYLIFRFLRTFPSRWRLPCKEMTIAICFALGISIAVTAEPGGGYYLILMGGLVLLFSGNCLLIARVESDVDRRHDPAAHYAGGLAGGRTRLPEIVSVLAMSSSVPVMIFAFFPLTSSGLLLCSGLTVFLSRLEGGGGFEHIQAKADGILMIPLLLALSKAAIFR